MTDKKQYMKEWRSRNKEKQKQYHKQWEVNNKEHRKEYMKKYNKQWKIDNNEYHKQYHQNNKEHMKQYYRQKRKTDLKYNLNRRMGSAILKALKGNKAGRHWESLVGYSLNDLIKHLKTTMPKNCTWNDYMNGKLHIDHRTPISVFNFDNSNQIDFRKCWALKNLQLLPAEENLIKGAKLKQPFQPSLKMAI